MKLRRIKTVLQLISFFSLSLLISPAHVFAAHTRVTNPTHIGVEVLGRGLLYSVQADRVLMDDFVAGIGFGSVGLRNTNGTDAGKTSFLIPVYGIYYFAREAAAVFATGGVTVGTNTDALDASVSGIGLASVPIIGNVGVGVEVRSDPGFLFRVTGYGMLSRTVMPWILLTVGYSF